MRCLEVRPFFKESHGVFGARDLRASLKLNPAVECISGHAVHPYSDLDSVVDDVRYFTTLRDPVERCISAYFYGREVRNRTFTFEEHLRTESKNNIQTRWIAGEPDLEAAKQILSERVFLIGRTERLAEFVLLLANRLAGRNFVPEFRSKNLRSSRTRAPATVVERYRDEIVARNQLDIDLVDYVETHVMPRQRELYGPTFERDLQEFEDGLRQSAPGGMAPYVDYVVRKAYYDPVMGLMRVWNGLSYRERI